MVCRTRASGETLLEAPLRKRELTIRPDSSGWFVAPGDKKKPASVAISLSAISLIHLGSPRWKRSSWTCRPWTRSDVVLERARERAAHEREDKRRVLGGWELCLLSYLHASDFFFVPCEVYQAPSFLLFAPGERPGFWITFSYVRFAVLSESGWNESEYVSLTFSLWIPFLE